MELSKDNAMENLTVISGAFIGHCGKDKCANPLFLLAWLYDARKEKDEAFDLACRACAQKMPKCKKMLRFSKDRVKHLVAGMLRRMKKAIE